jgi:hypothetical protein
MIVICGRGGMPELDLIFSILRFSQVDRVLFVFRVSAKWFAWRELDPGPGTGTA